MSVRLTKALRQEYIDLFRTVEVNPASFATVDKAVAALHKKKSTYQAVAEPLHIPWFVVAAIHKLESNQSFSRHLHNGDSLQARTVHVPAGRPKAGSPPFSWQDSATDALKLRRMHKVDNWTLARTLYEIEGYNGWGYRRFHAHVKSPYLWSSSNHYQRGKYVADGTWSDTAKSKQMGAAVVIKRMQQQGLIEPFTLAPSKPVLRYSKRAIARGEDLQRFLNSFDGISLRVDGWTGDKTSDAMEKVFGFRLHGDPES